MGELVITTVPQPAGNTEYKFGEVDTNLLTLDGNFTSFTQSYYVDSASFAYKLDNLPSGSGGGGNTSSLLVTASANPVNSEITFTKGDSTTFKITTGNDKANISGGNNFSGDQRIVGGSLTADTSLITPILQGRSTAKTDINTGAGPTPILTFSSGSYAALIIDGYIVGRIDPSYYGVQYTTAIINPANPDQIFFTTNTPILSPAASGSPDSGTPATFNTSSLVFSGGTVGTNVEIYITNTSGVDITYRTIVRAFPIS